MVLGLAPLEHPGRARSDIHHRNVLRHCHRTAMKLGKTCMDPLLEVLTPYSEQQPPLGQLPQTVFPLPAPQEPSVVSPPVVGAFDGAPMTGSSVFVAPAAAEVVVPVIHPFWQPLSTRQLRQVSSG